MQTIFQINANELDQDFINGIKALFKNKDIEIAVYERDETEHLLRSPTNREYLSRVSEDIDANQKIIVPDQEQFQ